MNEAYAIGGPHTHDEVSVARTMSLVMLALLPATAFSLYQYGWPALNLFIITVALAWLSEILALRLMRKPLRLYAFDGSAILTGWLLALSLPPWAPWWIAVVGAVFAMLIGKHVFGGLGQNVFNPAMLGRIGLLISFPLEMTTWVPANPLFSSGGVDFIEGLRITFYGIDNIDAISSATVLGHIKTELTRGHSVADSLHSMGWSALPASTAYMPGSLGETSAILILLGGIYLLLQRVISWHIPLAMLAAVALMATIFHHIDPARYADAAVHLLSGGLMLGAFFIATDYVTSPSTRRGQVVFGFAIGLLAYIIRTWGGYPEGVGFAVLIMNAATPVIDHFIRPRIYGRKRSGKSLAGDDSGE